MNLFLTGASGFLGSHTALELIRRGHQVTALVRKTSNVQPLRSLSLHWVEGSIPDNPPSPDLFQTIDVVVHIAGIVKALSEKDFIRVNAEGTESLVKAIFASPRRPKRFIHISTIAVHDPSRDGNDFCLAPTQCHPLSGYGRSKLAGEKALEGLKGKTQTLILRPPVLYGPRDREFLPLFRSIRWGIAPLFQSGGNAFSICYIEDVARAIADLVETSLSSDEIFCLDDGAIHTWKSVAETVSQAMGKKAVSLSLPKPLFKVGAGFSQLWARLVGKPTIFTLDKINEMEQPSWLCGMERLQNKIGWKPKISLTKGMEITYQSYKDSKFL